MAEFTLSAFSGLYSEIRQLCPSVPEPVLQMWMRNAAIKFCKESKAWQEELLYPIPKDVKTWDFQPLVDAFNTSNTGSQAKVFEVQEIFYKKLQDTDWTSNNYEWQEEE